MNAYLQLLRPQQWLKNAFVLAPLFFSNNMLNWPLLQQTLLVCLAFCFISSAIYCLNDIRDAEADRQHPKKRLRPVASGAVSPAGGYVAMGACIVLSLALVALAGSKSGLVPVGIIAAYFLMNVAYCLKLKQYAIIDITIIAVGFVMRVLIGGFTTGIPISGWIVLMTFLLALFLALAKRGDDFRLYEQTGTKPRTSITGYNRAFINQAIAVTIAVIIVCYLMYTMSDEVIARMGTRHLYLTAIWVVVGLLRYLQNATVYTRSGSPTKLLLNDRFIQLCIVGWIVSFFIIIYL